MRRTRLRVRGLGAALIVWGAVAALVTGPRSSSIAAPGMSPGPGAPMTVVGQIGGASQGLAVDGDYAYLGIGPRLVVLDLSRPENPTKIGESEVLSGIVADVALSGDYAVVAVSELYPAGREEPRSAIELIDVRVPSAPRHVGAVEVEGTLAAVAVAGRWAYATAGWYGFMVVDLADPARPQIVGNLELDGDSRDVAIGRGIVVVTDGRLGIVVVDVTVPVAPRQVAEIAVDGVARGLALDGATAYVVAESPTDGKGRLNIVDLGDPAHPRRLAAVPMRTVAGAVAVSDSRAFAVGRNVIESFDVTRPEAPVPEHGAYWQGVGEDLVVAGGLAFTGVGPPWMDAGMRVIDVRDSGDFAAVGEYEALCCVGAVAVAAGRVYLGGGGSHVSLQNLVTMDASTPGAPAVVAELAGLGLIHDMALVGAHAFVANSSDAMFLGDLAVLDLGAPDGPAVLARMELPGSFAVEVVGDTAFVGTLRGFSTVSVADPARPRVLARTGTATWYSDFAVVDGFAFAATGGTEQVDWRVEVLDVHEPLQPHVVASLPARGMPGEIAVDGRHAYIASRSGVQIIDVADPAAPREIGFLELPGDPVAIAVQGERAYVALWNGPVTDGLAILDIADPAAVAVAGVLPLPGAPSDVTAADGLVYVGDGEGGLFILRPDGLPGATGTPTPPPSASATPSPTRTILPTSTVAPAPALYLPVAYNGAPG